MTKVIERTRVSEEMQKRIPTASGADAVLRTAKQIAQGLILRPEILEVAMYGNRINKKGGYNLHLLIEVSDDELYELFLLNLKKFTALNKSEWNRNYSDSLLRRMALGTVWKDMYAPDWRAFFALGGGDIHIDACVVPQNYRDRIDQLADQIPHHNPEFIRSFGRAEVLAAKRFEI